MKIAEWQSGRSMLSFRKRRLTYASIPMLAGYPITNTFPFPA